MGCISIPKPILPNPPSPFSFAVPIVAPSFSVPNLCCIPPVFAPFTPQIPMPSVLFNPATITALRAVMKAAQAYIDAFPIDCPRD